MDRMVSRRFDAIVIGAGHNGLAAAAYLARKGLAVLVLERRETIGGATATREFHTGYRVDTYAHRLGPVDPRVLRDLDLVGHGLEIVRPDPGRLALGDGRVLACSGSVARTAEAIGAFSAADAGRWPAFCQRIEQAVGLVARMRQQEPPDLPAPPLRELLRLGAMGWSLRRLGRRAMPEVMRLLPMSVAELAEEWFETVLLRGAIGGA